MKKKFTHRLLYLYLFLEFHFCYSQEVKVDTVFVGNVSNFKIENFFKKNASVIILMRHGEKENNGKNPHLSEAGKNRAQNLALLFKNLKIDYAYSTDFYRTRETLQPLVSDKKLELAIYSPSKISDFVNNILGSDQSVNIISGHSNTNPVLLNEICKKSIFNNIPDHRFNDIYIVNVFRRGMKIKVFHFLY